MSVVREYEETEIILGALSRKYGIQGDSTIRKWINKFGAFDWQNKTLQPMAKTKDQELLELREKVKVLEWKNARLEHELEQKDMKAEFFDLMIDIAEEEYKVDMRKNAHLGSQTTQGNEWHFRMRDLQAARDKQAEELQGSMERSAE